MAVHRKAGSYTGLENLGRVRLSKHFYMRNFLYSEIANFYGRQNMPDHPQVAIAAGKGLCENLLEPLVETFGPIEIRSGFRSSELNHFGATQVTPQKCSRNSENYAGHIWDRRGEDGSLGATVSIVIPWFADQYNAGRDWRDLAWWIYDHLPCSEQCYFPVNAAFNLQWREIQQKDIYSYIDPLGLLIRVEQNPDAVEPDRALRYSDFPPFRGIQYPPRPSQWSDT
ncbi:MAG: hypothetical protein AAF141_06745 [Pseudomonadota bacterium]